MRAMREGWLKAEWVNLLTTMAGLAEAMLVMVLNNQVLASVP